MKHVGMFQLRTLFMSIRHCGLAGFKLLCYDNIVTIQVNKLYYNVLSFPPDGIVIDPLRSSCLQNLKGFSVRGMSNYAISADNLVQFSDSRNTTGCSLKCNIPMQARNEECMFDRTCCYLLQNETIWHPDFAQFSKLQCQAFISWVWTATSTYTFLDMEYGLKLEWGILGTCHDVLCDPNAVCQHAVAVQGSVRCSCKDGYLRDGFVQSTGCRREISIPVLAVVSIVVVSCILVRRQMCWKRGASEDQSIQAFVDPLDSQPPSVETFLNYYSSQVPSRYSYSLIRSYTNNFADKLGKGGFGTVYKGKLPNGRLIAVKILDESKQSEQQFIAEVATIGRTYHVNLVRLLGYCSKGSKRALVYEYMVNGSLEKYIHGDHQDKLDWKQLYSIALGTARGILYLHEDCSNRILHCDIKPHNILLDANFLPKVADFGLAKITNREESHVSGAHGGTIGYAAPEMWSRMYGPVTDRCDCYSYGMLLMEMVGGRKNFDLDNKESRSSQFFYPEWVFKQVENGEFGNLRKGNMSEEDEGMAKKLSLVGLWCIQFNASRRPPISKVVQMLEGLVDITTPPFPFPVDTPLQPSASYPSSSSS
eukprot:PITA_30935